jgi:deoxyhypusine synthase
MTSGQPARPGPHGHAFAVGNWLLTTDYCLLFLVQYCFAKRTAWGGAAVKNNHHEKHTNHDGAGIERKLHDPIEDRLVPLEPLDLRRVHSVDDLVRAMAKTAFTGRQLGEAADVLEAMARDKDCFVVMTLAGAMTVAKQGLVITELIDRGMVNAIVSTGALMAHGLVEATGRAHFRYNPDVPDEELYEQGYNRVYDTLEPETNLDEVEEVIAQLLDTWDHNDIVCSYKLNHAIGAYLAKHAKDQRGILKSAYEKGVPVFVPAFTDSELGLDLALSNRMRESTGRHKLRFDPFEDLEHFAATLLRQTRLGIFTIGGGVPRNWSQQFGPFIELRHRRMGENVPLKRYHYGLRICPEPVYWGGLSGSPYSEAVSWGKFVPPAEGGQFGEVFVDATVGLPLIVAAVLERLDKDKSNHVLKAKREKVGAKK